MNKICLLLALFLGSMSAKADFRGSISFSAEEVARHKADLPVILKAAAECLQNDFKTHVAFYKKWGISAFYGDRSSFANDPAGRRDYLRSYENDDGGFWGGGSQRYTEAQITYFLRVLQPTSCVGLALKCLGKGFETAGEGAQWDRLKSFTKDNDVSGGALQHGLQLLGWRLFYWNPDVSKNAYWDAQEQDLFPGDPKHVWGAHAYNWAMVKSKRRYEFNSVDDISTLVNFGKQVPAAIKPVPFFVGVAHMGYHVFPGTFGQIIEGHSTRRLDDSHTLETSPFNPLLESGGPRGGGAGGRYKSGLIAIPPGYITPVENPAE